MDEATSKTASSIKYARIFYGGKTAKRAKSVAIECLSETYSFTLVFRSKNGGVYPTHLMCDFKEI